MMNENPKSLIVIAVSDHNPSESDDLNREEVVFTAPDLSVQLSVQRGQKFEVLGRNVAWWLYVKSLDSKETGYIPSTCVVPLNDDITTEEECELDGGAELTSALVNKSVDLKFFPDAPVNKDETRKPCPEDTANIFSKLTFWWMTGLIYKGYKKPLTDSDLWAINKKNTSAMVVPKFVEKWRKAESKCCVYIVGLAFLLTIYPVLLNKLNRNSKDGTVEPVENETAMLKEAEMEDQVKFSPNEKEKENKKKKKLSLRKIMVQLYWRKFLLAIIFKLFNDCIQFVQPQILRLLIEYIETKNGPDGEEWRGYIFALSMCLVAMLQSIALHQYFHVVSVLGLNVRTAVIGMVYTKALALNNSARKESTAGEMVNLMSVDAQRLMDLFTYINIVWSAPLQIIISLYFLYDTMGVSILAGVAVMLLLIPVNFAINRVARKLQVKQMGMKDLRIKMMNEILNGIKVLKMYAWETSFMKKVSKLRKEELKHLKNSSYLQASITFTFTCAPFLVSLATFGIYVMTGNELSATKAFVAISLFNIMRFPLTMLPNIILSIIQAQVSLQRLTEFLHLEELDPDNVEKNMPEHISTQAIHVENGTFSWERNSNPTLRDIHLNIPRGSLVAVVGQVGCGKSTLLSALLGETEKIDGKVYVKGSVAYVPQQAWIQNATLRDNILFGKSFNGKRYEKVVYTCALQTDLDILPGGDLTEIGEKGINLSGGQKQRVSLARAVYFSADIYLLDDPLSAVDAHVGRHIFDKVIGPRGKLRKKTRVLVTHGISFLPQVDQIIVLQGGRISEVGTYTELVSNQGAFAEFLSTYATEKQAQLGFEKPEVEEGGENGEDVDGTITRVESIDRLDSVLDVPHLKPPRVDSISVRAESTSVLTVDTADLDGLYTKDGTEEVDRMIEEETSKTGRIHLSVFWEYIKSLTLLYFTCIVAFLMLSEAFSIGAGIWLARWSSSNITSSKERDTFLGVYAGLGISQAFCVFVWSMFLAVGTRFASRHLHQRMLVNIMHSPMSFFETTPLGRIVNRFSKDVNGVDQLVPRAATGCLRTFFGVVATLFTISFATPVFLAVIIPLGILYIFIQRLFVSSSRQLMRIESVSRSPIYNNFLETINGTSTIRAFAQQQRFIEGNYYTVDENQAAHYPTICSNRWLAVRLEFVGNLVIFFAALFAVISRDSIQSGLVGLSITYALQVTQTLNWMVRMSSELETNIVAVERMKEYSETPTEAEWIILDSRPQDGWPDAGNIVMEEFDLKYREGLPLVLKNINCDIKPGERIGIVGRTGAGKSTLTLALFRIMERAGGRILIDGVDIATIGLQDLRSRLTIIPQDPVLFSGSLRLNLDPFDRHTDDELWNILELSHLKNFVSGLEEGLLHPVSEGGENLSVGQRQLVCLARALLRQSKILVLDEATAAVDLETDELIQQTIRREFADRTVFTIAHRLNTIMDYTRIMVLDKGFMMEFDTPANLLKQQGIFYSMAHDAGLA